MTAPHEQPEFTNSAEYTLSITFRVAGGARPGTAHDRARRIAERLTDATARAAGVVEVSAVGGESHEGRPLVQERIRFPLANSGSGTAADPTQLARYLDPDHERALESLAGASAARRRGAEADQARRRAVACLNTNRLEGLQPMRCLCVYCEPAAHEQALSRPGSTGPVPIGPVRCVCGRPVAVAGMRCSRHRDIRPVAIEGDGAVLTRLVQRLQADRPPPGRRPDGPDLPPPGR